TSMSPLRTATVTAQQFTSSNHQTPVPPHDLAEERGFDTQLQRSKEAVHSDQSDPDVHEDVQSVAEVVARQKDQPGEWIEDFVFRIRGNRLSGAEVAIPVWKLAAVDDLAHDLFRRVVVAREIAHVEIVDADEDVAEGECGENDECGAGEEVFTIQVRAILACGPRPAAREKSDATRCASCAACRRPSSSRWPAHSART